MSNIKNIKIAENGTLVDPNTNLPLPSDLYSFDLKTRIFRVHTNLDTHDIDSGLIIFASEWDNVTFYVGSNCIIYVGSDCTVVSGDCCSIHGKSACTFSVGNLCTFSHIVNKVEYNLPFGSFVPTHSIYVNRPCRVTEEDLLIVNPRKTFN